MPRRSGGRSGSRSGGELFSSRPRPAAAAASTASRNTPSPAPAAPAPPAAPVLGGGSGGLGSVVAEGMAFGGGSAIAHRAVDAIAGPRVIRHETVASPAPAPESATMAGSSSLGGPEACGPHLKAFQDCLNSYGNEISKCQFYMDMLSECRKNSGASLNA